MEVIRRLHRILSPSERKLVVHVLAFASITAVVQTLAVFSIMPFMALVTNPESGPGTQFIIRLGSRVGVSDQRNLLIAAGASVLVMVVAANLLAALSLRRVQLSAWNIHHYLSQRLLAVYLRLPYAWTSDRHSARLTQNVLAEVGVAVQAALVPLMTALVRGLEALMIMALLLVLDPVLTLSSGVGIGGAYVLIYLGVRRVQVRLGEMRVSTDERRYRVATEALGGIKEIKSLGAEEEFVRRFGETGPDFVHTKAWSQALAELPRYLLEVLSLGTVLTIFLVLMLSGGKLEDLLPKLVLFGFAGYKLVPSLHQVFSALSMTRFALDAVRAIDAHFDLAKEIPDEPSLSVGPIHLTRTIEFAGTTFRYSGAESNALESVSFQIERGEFIGVVGSTGAGKTTLVDVLLGLLVPQAGEIRIDGAVLDIARMGAKWRETVGYVPQSIFLSDDTIERNIAFGVRDGEIDTDRVRRVAQQAEVHAFVDELPEGYQTLTGERGVRLSGGQRQRIGLARALYRNPSLLVLDEATSALDGATEAAVMKAIYGLERERTVVVIAHRLQTVRKCDRILLLDRGLLVAQGTFAELLQQNDLFRVMARGVEV